MRNSELFAVDMSFLSRLIFLFSGDNREISTLLANERHRYYRLGKRANSKRVMLSALKASKELERYVININTREERDDLVVGISLKLNRELEL